MNKQANGEVDVAIENRFFEDHPFKNGRAGLEEFAELEQKILVLPKRTILGYLPRIDDLYWHLKPCNSCRAKLCAFADVLFGEYDAETRRLYRLRLTRLIKTIVKGSRVSADEWRQIIYYEIGFKWHCPKLVAFRVVR